MVIYLNCIVAYLAYLVLYQCMHACMGMAWQYISNSAAFNDGQDIICVELNVWLPSSECPMMSFETHRYCNTAISYILHDYMIIMYAWYDGYDAMYAWYDTMYAWCNNMYPPALITNICICYCMSCVYICSVYIS